MPDDPQQTPAPSEPGAGPVKKKRGWIVCCCAGCSVAFLTVMIVYLLYFSLVTAFLRELIGRR